MTLTRKQGRHASSVRQRVDWLMRHPKMWNRHIDAHLIVYAMKRDGLVAKSTYWKDVNVEALCSLAVSML